MKHNKRQLKRKVLFFLLEWETIFSVRNFFRRFLLIYMQYKNEIHIFVYLFAFINKLIFCNSIFIFRMIVTSNARNSSKMDEKKSCLLSTFNFICGRGKLIISRKAMVIGQINDMTNNISIQWLHFMIDATCTQFE